MKTVKLFFYREFEGFGYVQTPDFRFSMIGQTAKQTPIKKMQVFFLNYKEEVKRIITETYEPADFISKEFAYSTTQLTDLLMNIIPSGVIDEHLVYESLLELGFTPRENETTPLLFEWYFKRKFLF